MLIVTNSIYFSFRVYANFVCCFFFQIYIPWAWVEIPNLMRDLQLNYGTTRYNHRIIIYTCAKFQNQTNSKVWTPHNYIYLHTHHITYKHNTPEKTNRTIHTSHDNRPGNKFELCNDVRRWERSRRVCSPKWTEQVRGFALWFMWNGVRVMVFNVE